MVSWFTKCLQSLKNHIMGACQCDWSEPDCAWWHVCRKDLGNDIGLLLSRWCKSERGVLHNSLWLEPVRPAVTMSCFRWGMLSTQNNHCVSELLCSRKSKMGTRLLRKFNPNCLPRTVSVKRRVRKGQQTGPLGGTVAVVH